MMALLGLLVAMGSMAQNLSERAEISLLTCGPGEELYARYGHTAIRVADPVYGLDVVFNYGIFDFNTEHFYWKFMRGETYYQLGIERWEDFQVGYAYQRRSVAEQVLNLTQEQKQILFDALVENYQPENRYYLYNFVFDNCATRPYLLIKKAVGDTIVSDYKGAVGKSYRSFIRHYTRTASWANFGINLLFGPKADRAMRGEERLFLPEELMFYMEQATTADGTRLVKESNASSFGIASVPFYASWYFGVILFAVVMVVISLLDKQRGKLSWWVDAILCVGYVVVLLLVGFLTFFSLHPLVGFGWRLLIIPLIHLCTRLLYIFRAYF